MKTSKQKSYQHKEINKQIRNKLKERKGKGKIYKVPVQEIILSVFGCWQIFL